MVKVAFVLAVVLAGSASAAGWRKLQIDGSSEAAFQESVALFQDKLSPSRQMAFALSLQDVWLQGTQRANAVQREYTSADYFQELDGLGYDEVVKLTDPTGGKAKSYRARYYYARASGVAPGSATTWRTPSEYRDYDGGSPGRPYRGWTDLTGPGVVGDPKYQ